MLAYDAEFRENALGGTRTHGLSLRRAALYPTELQAHEFMDDRAWKVGYGAEGGI